MYTLIEEEFTRHLNGIMMHRVTIQVDTADDVPTADDRWDTGSICIIAATHKYKLLNSEREWV